MIQTIILSSISYIKILVGRRKKIKNAKIVLCICLQVAQFLFFPENPFYTFDLFYIDNHNTLYKFC